MSVDPEVLELITLALEISRPVEPLVYEVHPTDEGEGDWWRAADPWEAYLAQPREPSNDWWAGCLEGFRLALELAKLPDPVAGVPRPAVLGRRTR